MGHGIIELVEGMQGKIADLAKRRSLEQLDRLRERTHRARRKRQLPAELLVELRPALERVQPDSIDKQTIELEIMDNGHRIARYSTAAKSANPATKPTAL